MNELGLQGMRRGRRYKVTTRCDDAQSKPKDLVDRNFAVCKPDELWVADITYVQIEGKFRYVALVVDVYSLPIVGWSVADSLATDLPLRALKQALAERQSARPQLGIRSGELGAITLGGP